LYIGNVNVNGLARLAPMAGISNIPFRLISTECGSGMTTSEEIDSASLIMGNRRTSYDISGYLPKEKPIALQLLGSNIEMLVPAAIKLQDRGADIIDINMGCPMPKINKTGRGAALMKDVSKTAKILKAIRTAIEIPLTVKIRGGWDDKNMNAPEVAKMAESEGVDAITVHPRTRAQKFSGHAPWDIIKSVVETVNIPVTGNGDVRSMSDARKMKNYTGCNSVMIGRAAIGNPWVFNEKIDSKCLRDQYYYKSMIIKKHIGLIKSQFEKGVALLHVKKHLCWYAGTAPMVRSFRKNLFAAQSESQVEDIFLKFWTALDPKNS